MKTFEAQLAKAMEVQAAHEEEILKLPNVQGVGIGNKIIGGKETSELVLQIYVEKKLPKSKLAKSALVAEAFDDVKSDVIEVGKIEAQAFTARLRPAQPGFSIGHYKITAGTFGCLVQDRCCKGVYILSNNHVLANSNVATGGDPILQPGAYDGGAYPADMIARLYKFVPIRFNNPARYNLVDAALARPTDMRNVMASIIALGIPKGVDEAVPGMDVVKSGRTTQTTAGKVIGVNASIAVGYGAGKVGYFRNQIVTDAMSQGGDSGSLLLSRSGRKAVGLLFAGSSQATIHNNISNVLMALNVELITA
jgi:S1-C subfamily serine protease